MFLNEIEIKITYLLHSLQLFLLGVEGVPLQTTSPLDRKDALTRRPLDFDQEEETRKVETSKWLDNHFGSESRSSNNSIIDEEEESKTKTGFFNVTIKSQPVVHKEPTKAYATPVRAPSRQFYDKQIEPEKDKSYYQGTYSYLKNLFFAFLVNGN